MRKPENLWLIIFLGTLVMCLCTVIFWGMLKFAVQDGERTRDRRENQKATLALRDEREKMERLLRTVKITEKGEE
jgi:type VI protein secretion system component VasK